MKISNFELPDSGLVLIAGRPGIGKSYVVLEMANELNQKGIKPVLLYADGQKSHSSCHYENGVVRESPSKLSRVKKVYPDLPYIVEDYAAHYFFLQWEVLIKNIIEFEHPKVIFINALVHPNESITSNILKHLQNIAKKNDILMIAESQASRNVERRKDCHPGVNDIKCTPKSLRYVDQCVFVYRDSYYTQNDGEELSKIEVYSAEQMVSIPFDIQKYSV